MKFLRLSFGNIDLAEMAYGAVFSPRHTSKLVCRGFNGEGGENLLLSE
ncbi:MAG: hypothetical protein KBT04_04490 [Bacteroidales bacterium]|nr:hypothetical protein [Candidatus Colimorpha onthohippi]